MSPIKSTFGRSVGKFLNSFRDRDLTLNSSVVTDRTPPFLTSGGTIYTPGNGYLYHVFTNPGTFRVGSLYSGNTIDLLLVAGGGSGGSYYGGGGGAGGVVSFTSVSGISNPSQYSIEVGEGGVTAGPGNINGNPGSSTTFSGLPGGVITAIGGGGGHGGQGAPGAGLPGGSGGGASAYPGGPSSGGTGGQPAANTAYTPLTPFNQYGNPGGSYPVPSTGYKPAGGGGAGGAGSDGAQTTGGGPGGVGIQIPWAPYTVIPILGPVAPRMGPTGLYYGGGGGAGGYSGDGGAGGLGGGGTGTPQPTPVNNFGADLLGGGGGGRHPASSPGENKGGNGICVLRVSLT